jgi:hypothetical protein
MTIENIKNSPVYKQILNDSFGGVMYNLDNQKKYNASDIITMWDNLTESQKGVAGGIMKGAIEFVKGN